MPKVLFPNSRLKKILATSLIYWSTVIFLILLTLPLQAQNQNDSLKVELDPIQVTAIRSTISEADAPISLSTYSQDLASINHSSSLSISDLGNKLPGLWVNDRQNYALGERLTIRGVGWRSAFGVRGIQVVLDDIPLTVADGQTMINVIDPAFIRRAELVRGPAATYWGNSSGGVLYLSTKPSYNDSLSVRARSMAGSYGMRKGEAEFSFAGETHNMTGYSSYLKTDGYRDYSQAKVLRSGVSGSIDLTSKSKLTYQAAGIYMPEAQHPSSLTAELAESSPQTARQSFIDAEAGKSITQTQAGLSYVRDTSAGIINITGYGIYRDLSNPLPFGIITVNRWAGGLRASLDKSWNNINLQFGVESKLQNDDRTEYENTGQAQRGAVTVDQTERVWNQAAFATATYSVQNFNFLGGIRYDRLTFDTNDTFEPSDDRSGSRTFESISPSVGINYQFNEQTIFANLSTSFEAPTTTELVNRPGGGNGFNPSLKPEQTIGFELGARGANTEQTLQYDIAAYRLWITDLLFPYQLDPNGPTFYRNQGETNHTGIEGRIAWQMTPGWKLATTANLTNAVFKEGQNNEIENNEVPGIPNLRTNTTLTWTPGNFITTLSHEYVSNYYVDNENTAQNDRYNIFDFKISYRGTANSQTVNVHPFLNIKNLFNTRYNGSVVVNAFGDQYFEPAPGRNWQLGISVQF